MNDSLRAQRRALEHAVRLERRIRQLSRDVRHAVARANSELCSLARMVFQNDAEFRAAVIADAKDHREPALAGSSATE